MIVGGGFPPPPQWYGLGPRAPRIASGALLGAPGRSWVLLWRSWALWRNPGRRRVVPKCSLGSSGWLWEHRCSHSFSLCFPLFFYCFLICVC